MENCVGHFKKQMCMQHRYRKSIQNSNLNGQFNFHQTQT